MTGAEWGALAVAMTSILSGVGWLLSKIAAESRERRQAHDILQQRSADMERRHATKVDVAEIYKRIEQIESRVATRNDIEHLQKSIDRLHQLVENLTSLFRDKP